MRGAAGTVLSKGHYHSPGHTEIGHVEPALSPCECGGDEWEEIFTSIPFRLIGACFHVNDYGRPEKFTYSTKQRTKMRKEIREAYDHGEIPPGVNCRLQRSPSPLVAYDFRLVLAVKVRSAASRPEPRRADPKGMAVYEGKRGVGPGLPGRKEPFGHTAP